MYIEWKISEKPVILGVLSLGQKFSYKKVYLKSSDTKCVFWFKMYTAINVIAKTSKKMIFLATLSDFFAVLVNIELFSINYIPPKFKIITLQLYNKFLT